MKYILSELSIKTPQGWKCDSCKRKFWKGLHIKWVEDENKEMRVCNTCWKYHLKEKIKKFYDDNWLIWIFDSRFYKCK